jgi:hypothetical protein
MNYIKIEVSGKKFNEIFRGITMYKFTNLEENHNGYQYIDGLNIDPNEFDTSQGECSKGGLYFTSVEYAAEWILDNEYVRNVTIPDDARICIYKTKFKADKIIVGLRTRICDSGILASEEVQRLAVQRAGSSIKHIKDPSEEIQMLAVKKYDCYIEYISKPTEEVQKLAVQQNGHAIRFIKDPSEEVQKLAVQQKGDAIQYIVEPSEEVQRLAVQQNGNAIQYIVEPSEEVQK